MRLEYKIAVVGVPCRPATGLDFQNDPALLMEAINFVRDDGPADLTEEHGAANLPRGCLPRFDVETEC